MLARIAVGSSGVLLAASGVLVMAGWAMRDPFLAGLTSFNAAACFAVLGLGLFGLRAACGAFVAVVAFLTLLQYLFALDLGIDQLVVEAWRSSPLAYPGRMTAICAALLLLAGIGLASCRRWPGLAWAAGVVLVGNGLLLLLGHVPWLAEVAAWTGWRETALGSALGVVLAGGGLMFLNRGAKAPLQHGPLLVLVVAAIGFNLWQALVSVELARAASDTADAARSLAYQLQRSRAQLVLTLERMAHRLERNPGAGRSGVWELDAQDYLAHLVGLRALALHDARGFIVPPVTGASGFAAAPSAAALTRAFTTMETVTTPGQVIVPYLGSGGPEAVVATVAYDELLSTLLSELLPGYGITMSVDGSPVYERYPGESAPRGTPVARFGIGGDVVDARWQATVWPEERMIEGHRGPLPLAVLLLSLVSAALVAVALRFSARLRKQISVDDAVWREAHDVLLLIARDGRIERVSNACRAVWGYEPSELVGKPFTMLSAMDDGELPVDPAERLSQRRDVQGMTLTTVAKDGRHIPMNWSSIWSDELDRMIAIGRDVTEQVEYEEELERRVAARTHELTLANAELEAFSYSVSHDLRTPLRAIAGFTELLVDEVGPSLDETGRHYLRRVLEGAERMGRLIDDLLRLGRLSRRDLEIERVDLTGIAERVAAHLVEAEPGKSVEFRIQAGLSAEADPRLIELVVENLFGNAWKFTAGRDPAIIEFYREGPIFTVRDNGVGFDMEHAGALFGVFQRLHGIHEFPGTGIGLATVRRIIERHGGEVWAHGETGEGARFHFTLGGDA